MKKGKGKVTGERPKSSCRDTKEALLILHKSLPTADDGASPSSRLFEVGDPGIDYDASSANELRRDKAKAERAEKEVERLRSENELREKLGNSARKVVWVQLIVCNVFVLLYGIYMVTLGLVIPQEVLIAWMSATVA